jgi:DNA-binding MarR family transcriptional regulator
MLTSLSVAESLRVSVGRLARRLRQQSLGGLTLSQTSILATLDRLGEMSMSLLAGHESISKPSTTGIVARLVEKGLVEKKLNPDDARSAIVSITESGSALLKMRREEKAAFLATQIEKLSEDERLVLARAAEIIERFTAET